MHSTFFFQSGTFSVVVVMAETGVCVCLQHFPIACRFQNTAIYLYIKVFEEKDEKQAEREREQRGERKGGGLMYVCILKVIGYF